MGGKPGVIAPDGSPVEVFRALPPGPAPAMVAGVLAPGSRVLDLGAGAGRLSTALAALGFVVTAVDISRDMLAEIEPPVSTVCADIEGLTLAGRWDAVILASYLVNDSRAAEYLATCARHVADGGRVIVQRYDPLWILDGTPDETTMGNVTVAVENLTVNPAGDRFSLDVTYRVDERTWGQRVHASIVDDDRFATLVGGAGLRLERWLDEYRTWAVLRKAV